MGGPTIDRIYITKGFTELAFLKNKAPDTPAWEEALEMGDEETAVLGNLGTHSTFFPLDPVDVMSIRKALSRPRTPSRADNSQQQ